MRISATSLLRAVCLGAAGVLVSFSAHAQHMTVRGSETISLKSGESQEVTEFYYVTNCISLLKGMPVVEVVQGPPGVTAEMKEALVVPREQRCPAPLKGAKLFVAAKDIEDPSYSPLILRISYDTRDGPRKFSQIYNLYLVP